MRDPRTTIPRALAAIAVAGVLLLAGCGEDNGVAPPPPPEAGNDPPVADAGTDLSAALADTVALDGSGSSDPDGDPLSFSWWLNSVPAGSAAALFDSTAVAPRFVLDVRGRYTAVLVVNDGTVDSAPDTVAIDTENSPPIAEAGPNRTVGFGTVTLNGSSSRDPDGDPLTYRWSFDAMPAGSAAALSDSTAVMPTFVADAAGQFVVRLVVNDGTVDSAPDLVTITADPLPGIAIGSRTIGAGLQFAFNADLGISNHGGVTVHIESDDPAVARVAPGAVTPGTPAIDVAVPDGERYAQYVVQGMAGATGTAGLTASAPGFSNGTATITLAQPAVAIGGLDPMQSVGTNRVFTIFLGLPNAAGTLLTDHQGASAGNVSPLVMTLTSSDGAVAHVAAGGDTAATIMFDLPVASFQPQATFIPRSGGPTTVSATVPGFAVTPSASMQVTVDQPNLFAYSRTIGGGLQFGSSGSIEIPNHGGVTVRLESDNPAVARVAPDAATPGTAFIDVVVQDGDDTFPYYVQGVAGATGVVTVTASAPGFDDGTGTITVVEPAVAIGGLDSQQSVGTNRTFTIFTGLPNAGGTGLSSHQAVSAGNVPPLVMTVISGDADVAHVAANGDTAGTVMFDLAAGSFQPQAHFIPLSPGPTTVRATVPGFPVTPSASVDVVVDPPGIFAFPRTIGGGLQFAGNGSLGIANHGGVTVHIASSDPAIARVAPDATTPGSGFIDVFVPNGSKTFPYVVQGVADTTGTVTVTATVPDFTDGVGAITVVQPGLIVFGLADTLTTGDSKGFSILVGIPNAAGTGLSGFQAMSAGNVPPILATVSSSDGAVGQLTADGTTAADVMVEITPGLFQKNLTFAAVGAGPTTVTASMPGFLSTTTATHSVFVKDP